MTTLNHVYKFQKNYSWVRINGEMDLSEWALPLFVGITKTGRGGVLVNLYILCLYITFQFRLGK